ncbi:hypothetical protein BGX24_012768, partial [Mortierella sp. AD032]
EYERTFDQNESLGLNDMRLDGYEGQEDVHPAHGLEDVEEEEELTEEQKEAEEISGDGVSGGH